MIVTDEECDKALDYSRDNADEWAWLRATKETLEDWTAQLEAKLMDEMPGEPEHKKKSYARNHQSYRNHLYTLHEARFEFYKKDALMKAAERKVSVWQSENRRQ